MKKILLLVSVCLLSAYGYSQTITANKTYVCEGETVTYTISNLPYGTTFVWETSSSMVLQTSPTATSATYKAVFNNNKGYGRVTARVTKSGQVSYLDNSSVWVGAPAPRYISLSPSGNCGFEKVCMNVSETIRINADLEREQGVKGYDWKLQPWQQYVTGYESSNGIQKTAVNLYLRSDAPRSATVVVSPYNGCPSAAFHNHVQNMQAGEYSYYSLSADSQDATPATVKVYSFSTGKLVHQEKAAINFNIQSTTLENGIYIVETTDSEGQVTRNKVMKEQ